MYLRQPSFSSSSPQPPFMQQEQPQLWEPKIIVHPLFDNIQVANKIVTLLTSNCSTFKKIPIFDHTLTLSSTQKNSKRILYKIKIIKINKTI